MRYIRPSNLKKKMRKRRIAAWIALATALAGASFWMWQRHAADERNPLIRAAGQLKVRPLEGRLTGWPYAPPQPVTRGDASPVELPIYDAALTVLLDKPTPHERAVALLASGETADAVRALREVAASTNTSAAWSDYAAALLARADELDDPSIVVDALAASDRAVRLAPNDAAPHFNRALALTRLGLLVEASREWTASVQADPSSGWGAEAAARLHAIPNDAANATESVKRIRNGDADLPALVARFPQQARAQGESVCMAEWADAVLAGNDAAAAASLSLARRIGDALRARSGERLLRDVVAQIDATSSRATLTTIARGYIAYRAGRKAHAQNQAVVAEQSLREAASLFQAAGSPMAFVSRYYIGSSLYAQTRTAEVAALLDELAAEHPEERGYYAVAMQIGWERGLCAAVRGSISDAIGVFETSRALADTLGETQYAATMSSFIALARDSVNDRREAWRARSRAFEALSRLRDRNRIAVSLLSAATNEAQSREWARAAALFDVAIDAALSGKNAALKSQVYARRATVAAETGDSAAARDDLAEAQDWARTEPDERLRGQAEADVACAEGMLLRKSDPVKACARLAVGLRFFERSEFRIMMPRIHLERARVLRAMGRIAEARADLAAGIAILDEERVKLRELDQRATLFADADPLFAEAVDLALADGDDVAAFEITETQRARALLDRFAFGPEAAARGASSPPLRLAEIRNALAPDAAIVEYCALPSGVVAFVVRRDGMRVVRLGSARDVSAVAGRLMDAAVATEDLRPAAVDAAKQLWEPFAPDLAGVRRVVFVPDPETAGTPFAALSIEGRFLIETRSVLEAPSASLAVEASRRARTEEGGEPLVVGGDEFDASAYPTLSRLPFVESESKRIAALHSQTTLLLGESATRSRVLALLPRTSSFHFAGHSVAPAVGNRDAALLVAPRSGDRSDIRASDIAALNLSRTRLVVLAACKSAESSARNDLSENLSLAFLAAGATTSVATTDDLNDRISLRLMTAFHIRHVSASAEEALRGVILSEIGDASHHEWANLRIIGGSAALVQKERNEK